jgi:PAS domain S-box-containing protein
MKPTATILIVDDLAANRQLMGELLEEQGYQLVEAADGATALRLAAEFSPDLVLLDVMMPGMDGYEVCRQLRAIPDISAVPVLMVTALDDQGSRLAGIEAGADDFITKPFNIQELRARVRTITRLNRYRRLLEGQAELQNSERRFQSIFQHAGVGLVITEGIDLRIIEANRHLCEMLGYSETELKLLRVRDITMPDEIESDLRQVELVRSRASPEYSREKRYRKKDGTWVWAKIFVTPLDSLDARCDRMIAVIEDVTERNKAEASLRLQGAALAAAANGIVITDAAGCIEWVNPAFAGLTGYTADEAIGRNPRELLKSGAQDSEVYRQLWATILAGDVWRGELINRRKDGSHYSEEMTVTPLRSEQGEISHFIAIKQDVTARKQADTVLRESETRYRLLFEENPVPMWVSDPVTLRFMAVNAAAVQHYGYSAAEFLAMTIKEIHPPEDWPAVLEFIKNETSTSASSGESHHRLKNGTIVRVEIISRPLVFGGLPARLVLASDVTEKKLLEEKFLHAQRLESIGMLAAGIAHDLNNVLAPISMGAPILRRCVTAPADLKILNILVQSAERGAKLVKQILGFAHCGSGEFGPTQVKHLARDIIEVMEETFPRSIRLEHQIPADLWLVSGNATQIHQVLLNLCVNARDAMPLGGTLRFTAVNRTLDADSALAIPGAGAGEWLVLEIADTGTGIAPALLERIWTPFFTTKGPAEGTGLGLSTVRGIVAGHNGFVELQTEVGRGSTFRVYLPALTSEVLPPGEGIPAAASKGQGELILVVDDDAAIRDIAGDILGKHGYSVLTGADGVEAVTLFKAHPGEFSLVITDIDMPRLDGVALAHALHLLQPDLPIIAMSGLSDSVHGTPDLPAAEAGFQGFIQKPFGPDELLAVVSRLRAPAPVA